MGEFTDSIRQQQYMQQLQQTSMDDSKLLDKQLRDQAVQKLDQSMQQDAKHEIQLQDQTRTVQQQEQARNDVLQLREIAQNKIQVEKPPQQPINANAVLKDAIQETQRMATLSREAMQLRTQNVDNKKAADMIQSMKTAEEIVRPDATQFAAAVAAAVAEDDKFAFRTTAIKEDNAAQLHTSTEEEEETMAETKNQFTPLTRLAKKRLAKKGFLINEDDENYEDNYESSAEDEGKRKNAFIRDVIQKKRREYITKLNRNLRHKATQQRIELWKKTLARSRQQPAPATNQPHKHGGNRLKEKFKKGGIHF